MSLKVQIIRRPSDEPARSIRLTMAERIRTAEADAAAVVKARDVDVALERNDLARVGEQRHVQHAEGVPPVFGGQVHRVVVLEAVRHEAAQLVAAAERRLQIDRHRVVRLGEGQHDGRAEREHAASVEVRHELLHLELGLPERELLPLDVPVLAISRDEQPAASRTGDESRES